VKLRFWGVRGSVPWAIPAAIGHGCNTPCIELTHETSGGTLIIDAGSGIVGVGPAIAGPPRDINVLLTHYHWDHLQGLPFLSQLYAPGWKTCIHAPEFATSHADWLETLFRSPFFPVPMDRMPNFPAVERVHEGEFTVGPFDVAAIKLNHPGGSLAYRIRGVTGDVVYATDHEFGDPAIDDPFAEFASGAAALILDAHFTPDEYPQHVGWGHSHWRQCAEFAGRTNAGGLWLFHHKPGRSDQALADIRTEAQAVFAKTDTASEETFIDI